MGIKEMEQVRRPHLPVAVLGSMANRSHSQTVSTLHKQNFDLKLELYHRRERQTSLEDRVEALESEKGEVENLNDRLMEELEKRDKAVTEAVAMIIRLEAQVEELMAEREIVRRVDLGSLLGARRSAGGFQ
jgi:chromosome segregation ATPase